MAVCRKDLLDDCLVYGCPLAPSPAQGGGCWCCWDWDLQLVKSLPHHILLIRQQQSLAHRLSPCIFTATPVPLVGSRKDETRLMDV